MSGTRIAVAAPNALATAAAIRTAADGGNAVDAALAAALVTMVSEPGLVSLGSGGYLTIQPADGSAAVTVDGWVDVPGRGLPDEARGRATWDIETEYGGGTRMTIGHGSVAVPGTLRALDLAQRRYGRAPWAEVVAPATEVARGGFTMGRATHDYLGYVHDLIFGWHPASHEVLHDENGALVHRDATVTVPHLADALALIAVEGAEAMYTGELARLITADMTEHDGLVTEADLASYRAVVRPALSLRQGGWLLGTNPAPARGGVVAAALLARLAGRPGAAGGWADDDLRHLVVAQHEVLSTDPAALGAPSTAHVSVVDSDGTACAVTVSSGYSSGVLSPGTGIWLNNCLGEQELVPGGIHELRSGERLLSNMAPTVGRRDGDGAVLAIGSPGSDRIPTAIAQVLALHVNGGLDLAEAVAYPRVHVRVRPGLDPPVRVDHEEDLDVVAEGLPTLAMPAHAMYFGGVGVAQWEPAGGLSAAGDPRRTGAVAVTGGTAAAAD